ncbi:hypothetical protein GPJ56_004159 [Histomonas meleagridis]|uniref:uncharacterized protein n=1 Tax=Histomonas meleagridis TaxID=135588 RepID=UPI003559D0E0|nr:hypothetical protein GPJ56_004159 [Histomonas meleagridis]KAH0801500.1 hypothetical protein GO595_005752 [Histomonas meleagridis]
MRDKTAFVLLIVGFDENDVYDEEAEKREKEQFINDKLGLTPELAQMLNQMNQNGNLVSVEKIENNHALKRLHEENAMDDESELESD